MIKKVRKYRVIYNLISGNDSGGKVNSYSL